MLSGLILMTKGLVFTFTPLALCPDAKEKIGSFWFAFLIARSIMLKLRLTETNVCQNVCQNRATKETNHNSSTSKR